MSKEIITTKQGISIVLMFIMGSSLVLGSGSEAKRDIWIAVILAVLAAIPFYLIYSRILCLFPEKNLLHILHEVFGVFFGKIIILLYTWYAFHLGAIVIRNFTEFVRIEAMVNTPRFFITLCLGLLCIWAVKDGIELIGRCNSFFLVILLLSNIIALLFSIPSWDFDNMRPVLYEGISPVLSGALSIFTFPFAETVVFMMVFSAAKKRFNIYKVYLISLLFGGLIIFIVFLRNLLILGCESVSIIYFPSYTAVGLINIGDLIQRIEASVAINFLMAGFTKACICLYASTNGVAKLFNLDNYRPLVVPIGFVMTNLSSILYTNTIEMFYWVTDIYKYYALFYQVFLPLLILIAAEIKVRIKRSGNAVENKV